MSYQVKFTPTADKIISKWKKSNPNLYKKLVKVIKDMALHPRDGLGHPEPMVGGKDVTYSRRISAHDRIIYDIYGLLVKMSGEIFGNADKYLPLRQLLLI